MKRIMIVEDELIPANYLKKTLVKEGYEVIAVVSSGADAIATAKTQQPDIIFMDIMLSDHISGCDAAISISREQPEIIIIFLTAYSENQMLDMALESKAYAYLVKPYREQEIIMTLKLAAQKSLLNVFDVSDSIDLIEAYRYDRYTQRLYKDEKEVPLGPIALKLLDLLCQTPSSSLSIEVIMMHLWGNNSSQQTLRSLIHRIREQTDKELILNVNKLGYKINTASQK